LQETLPQLKYSGIAWKQGAINQVMNRISPKSLMGGLNFSRPRNRWELLAKASIPVYWVVGILGFKVPDPIVSFTSGILPFVAMFFTIGYISKFSVPQAFAVNYFKSFVEPICKAFDTKGAVIVYKNSVPGGRTTIDPKTDRVEILLPENLSITDTDKQSENGLVKLQEKLKSYPEEWIRYETKSGEERPLRIRIRNNADGLFVVDVPNNLNTLRSIQYDEIPLGNSETEKLAGIKRADHGKHALEDFSAELHKKVADYNNSQGRIKIDMIDFGGRDHHKSLRK